MEDTLKTILLSLSAIAIAMSSAIAAPCKDAKGKFVKCPDKVPAKAQRCRAGGKFAKVRDVRG